MDLTMLLLLLSGICWSIDTLNVYLDSAGLSEAVTCAENKEQFVIVRFYQFKNEMGLLLMAVNFYMNENN